MLDSVEFVYDLDNEGMNGLEQPQILLLALTRDGARQPRQNYYDHHQRDVKYAATLGRSLSQLQCLAAIHGKYNSVGGHAEFGPKIGLPQMTWLSHGDGSVGEIAVARFKDDSGVDNYFMITNTNMDRAQGDVSDTDPNRYTDNIILKMRQCPVLLHLLESGVVQHLHIAQDGQDPDMYSYQWRLPRGEAALFKIDDGSPFAILK